MGRRLAVLWLTAVLWVWNGAGAARRSLFQDASAANGPGVIATVLSGDELLSALQNVQVVGIEVVQDIDLASSLPAWSQLAGNLTLTRNVTIFGSTELGYSYPAINFRWWRVPGVKTGIRLAPNITLAFSRVLIKQVTALIPDMVVDGSNTSTVILYDVMRHLYVLDGPNLVTYVTGTARPNWYPGNNSAQQLAMGFCRTWGMVRKTCWPTAFMINSLVDDKYIWGSVPSFLRIMVFGMALVGESVPDAACTAQVVKGNASCVLAQSALLQAQEASSSNGWLQPPATLSQFLTASNGLAGLPPLPPAASLLPPFAVGAVSPPLTPRASPPANSTAAPSTDADNASDKGRVIGLAVGLSVGGVLLLLLLAVHLFLHRRRAHAAADTPDTVPDTPTLGGGKVSALVAHHHPPLKGELHARHARDSDPEGTVTPSATASVVTTQGLSSACQLHAPASDQTVSSARVSVRALDCHTPPADGTPSSTLDNVSAAHVAVPSLGGSRDTLDAAPSGADMFSPSLHESSSHLSGSVQDLSQHSAQHVFKLRELVTQTRPVGPTINLQVDMARDVSLGPKLGSGAMGTVYKALYRCQAVAVKVFAPGADLNSFGHEISILGRTAHPNVVRLLGACFHPQHVALVEELCDTSLEQLMYTHRRPGRGAPSSDPPFPDMPEPSQGPVPSTLDSLGPTLDVAADDDAVLCLPPWQQLQGAAAHGQLPHPAGIQAQALPDQASRLPDQAQLAAVADPAADSSNQDVGVRRHGVTHSLAVALGIRPTHPDSPVQQPGPRCPSPSEDPAALLSPPPTPAPEGLASGLQQASAPSQPLGDHTQLPAGLSEAFASCSKLAMDTSQLLPLSVVLSVASQTAAGLAYLHPTVIHRDLKPGNILLVVPPRTAPSSGAASLCKAATFEPTAAATALAGSITPGPGASVVAGLSLVTQAQEADIQWDDPTVLAELQVKLSDFGLSRMRDAMTIITQRPYCGTVPYMAPECFNRGQQGLTHKCDIYSFGVVLWELLHGARPWEGYSPAEVLFAVAVKHMRPPILVGEDRCPRQLRRLLTRCWDADPDRRPPALEVVRELALLQHQLGFL